MQSPNSYTRHVAVARTVTVAGVALDLYPRPVGLGWSVGAEPIFALAGIPEADRLDFMQRIGLIGALGAEVAWDRIYVSLLSRHAVAGVLANAAAEIDPATVAEIDAALAG